MLTFVRSIKRKVVGGTLPFTHIRLSYVCQDSPLLQHRAHLISLCVFHRIIFEIDILVQYAVLVI